MPIPKLRFLNQTAGTPRKPVPLRYAVLVTGLDVEVICALLSGELHYPGADDAGIDPLLTAYELGPQPSARRVALSAVKDIRSQLSPRSQRKSQLKLIPKSYYVWSDDLAQAFQHYIKLVPGRQNAREWRLELNWNPALGNLRPLINECRDPEDHGSDRSRQAAEVEKRNRQILAEYWQLKNKFPHLSTSNIAMRIAQLRKFETASRRIHRNLAPEAIRRVLTRYL